MFDESSNLTLPILVNNVLKQQPGMLPIDVANLLKVSEASVLFSMPDHEVLRVNGSYAKSLLTDLSTWGTVTTIVHVLGSIFEIKGIFPKGKLAHGFYNLKPGSDHFHGHIRLDLITDIALVSKPFMSKECHYFGFFNQQGESLFKIYLGRDKQCLLLADQVEKFIQLKQKWSH